MPVACLRSLAGIMIAMLGQCGMAQGVDESTRAHDMRDAVAPLGIIRFDMPPQPLQAALDQYHDLTGLSLLYAGEIADGKIAGAVQGDLTPAAALDGLLAGTGIAARYTSGQAFMLMPQAAAVPSQPTAPAGKQDYYAQLQAQVAAALCGNAATIPGSYRLALNIWIGADRAIGRIVLHPTGNHRRDTRIRAVLSGLALQSAPPADVVQPITLVILPRTQAQTGDCAAAAPAMRETSR